MIRTNSYMFRHQSAIFRESTDTKDHKVIGSIKIALWCLNIGVGRYHASCFVICMLCFIKCFVGLYIEYEKMHCMNNKIYQYVWLFLQPSSVCHTRILSVCNSVLSTSIVRALKTSTVTLSSFSHAFCYILIVML
jgi:hypothetical protein